MRDRPCDIHLTRGQSVQPQLDEPDATRAVRRAGGIAGSPQAGQRRRHDRFANLHRPKIPHFPDCRSPIANPRLPIRDCRSAIVDPRLSIRDSRLQIPDYQ
jgi:hypothetical protein